MNKSNNKVPIAILSCFLITFIIQGILKLSGVFVFEKAIDWEIFKIIDDTLWLKIIHYSLIMFVTMYCLSFVFTNKAYSTKWYHYIILVIGAFGITTLRLLVSLSNQIQIILDTISYIVIPYIICLTTQEKDRLFKNNLFGIVITLALQIMMYFAYLGLGYWSALLCSLYPICPTWVSSSANFLMQLEIYIAIISFLISGNMLVKYLKGDNMFLPINIASKKAKIEVKLQKAEKEYAKKSKELQALAQNIESMKAELAEIDKKNV